MIELLDGVFSSIWLLIFFNILCFGGAALMYHIREQARQENGYYDMDSE